MTKIDLITGFLGSGKTTFLKKYVRFLLSKGERICILEFDYGAINVDMMLLQEFNDTCDLEMVSGGCDYDCHLRRFKTKLIAMGMKKYDRVIVEPSGIFDPDEFFDSLSESPLDQWYEVGSVISIVDSGLTRNLSDDSKYILVSQLACSGLVVLSKTQLHSKNDVLETIDYLKETIKPYGVSVKDERIVNKPFSIFDEADYERFSSCGYDDQPHIKQNVIEHSEYSSLYFMDMKLDLKDIKSVKGHLFNNEAYGLVKRIKGFVLDGSKWFEVNLTKDEENISEIGLGQDVIIVIGEQLNEKMINSLFSGLKK